jgi:hypothetical protein
MAAPNLHERLNTLLATLVEAQEACDIEDDADAQEAYDRIEDAKGIVRDMKVMLDEQTTTTSISLVVVDNGDSDMEYWAFFDGDHAASFAALRGGDIEDITVMGESDALTAIDNEENA